MLLLVVYINHDTCKKFLVCLSHLLCLASLGVPLSIRPSAWQKREPCLLLGVNNTRLEAISIVICGILNAILVCTARNPTINRHLTIDCVPFAIGILSYYTERNINIRVCSKNIVYQKKKIIGVAKYTSGKLDSTMICLIAFITWYL